MTIPSPDLGDSLESKSKIEPTRPSPFPQQETPEQAPSRSFAPLMQQPAEAVGAGTPSNAPSPMDLASGSAPTMGADYAATHNHITQLQSKVLSLNDNLTQERFNQLSDGQKSLVDTKLNQFSQYVQAASNRVGGTVNAPDASDTEESGAAGEDSEALSTVKHWLSMLTQGNQQLTHVDETIAQAQQSPGQMSPAEMLRVQVNLSAADRAINFCSAVVGKFTEAIKTLGQTQL